MLATVTRISFSPSGVITADFAVDGAAHKIAVTTPAQCPAGWEVEADEALDCNQRAAAALGVTADRLLDLHEFFDFRQQAQQAVDRGLVAERAMHTNSQTGGRVRTGKLVIREMVRQGTCNPEVCYRVLLDPTTGKVEFQERFSGGFQRRGNTCDYSKFLEAEAKYDLCTVTGGSREQYFYTCPKLGKSLQDFYEFDEDMPDLFNTGHRMYQ